MYNRPDLPLSLKRKRMRNILLRIVLCLFLLFVVIFVIVMWGNKLFPLTLQSKAGYKGLQGLFYVILLILPFIISGVPIKLIDKSWSGMITSVKVLENLGTTPNPRNVIIFPKQDLILTIKTDAGKEIEFTVLSLANAVKPTLEVSNVGKIYYHTHEFCVGERVHKYYGYKHLFVSYEKYHQVKYCISCGSKNTLNEIACWHCGCELLSDKEDI